MDAYGNRSELLTITTPHDAAHMVAAGVVEVSSPKHGRMPEAPTLSPLAFTVPTRLTAPSETIRDFAARHLHAGAGTSQLLALAEAICSAVVYQSGATIVTTTADEALTLSSGVCQDHVQLFLSYCHTLGIPERYVSGYLDSGHAEHGASHAWVDVWVDEIDYSGRISLDVTHACLQDAGYCRLAVGCDYESAATAMSRWRSGLTSMANEVQWTLLNDRSG